MTQLDHFSRVAPTGDFSQDACEMDSTKQSEPVEKLAQLPRGKEQEWTGAVEKKRPLRLLDLPVDVLKEIIKEVTHTNDLTSLALTHSALHDLAIPYIYSRFDIVWPETQITTDTRTGVDALTYGLATLVMSEEAFLTPPSSKQENIHQFTCMHCGKPSSAEGHLDGNSSKASHRRKGNNFAQYTRKFSLGNGDPDWVQEYLISKESGKMLGTLVALAVARMQNLEAFVWDMPTGILRDVWSALSSIGHFRNGDEPRLEKIWVRYHFNKLGLASAELQNIGGPAQSQPPPQAVVGGQIITASVIHAAVGQGALPAGCLLATSYRNVEHPSFSILPPLRSLTVLEIDEPAYLDEMSVLVKRSVHRLRELRIGIAPLASSKRWPQQDQAPIPAISTSDTRVGYIASGGPLGMVMSRLYDCRPGPTTPGEKSETNSHHTKQVDAELVANDTHPVPELSQHSPTNTVNYNFIDTTSALHEATTNSATLYPLPEAVGPVGSVPPMTETREQASSAPSLLDPMPAESVSSPIASHELPASNLPHRPASAIASEDGSIDEPNRSIITHRNRSSNAIASHNVTCVSKQPKLRLEILELERVPISVRVLQKTIDWTVLTSLTLLNCGSDEELWKALKRTHTPRASSFSSLFRSETPKLLGSTQHKRLLSIPSSEYPLRLKKLHTNNASTALIAFLKESLAPNTLEWLFLQEGSTPSSKVTIDAIFRGPIRRHRESLKKILIDSGPRRPSDSVRGTKWKRWIFNREILSFITGGKMPRLRELAMAMDYKDWHFFLQRLPQIPHLRSLYIPNIADHVHGHQIDARELAMQIVDIVTLRPEVELCYMGITTKCFEILEQKHFDDTLSASHDLGATPAHGGHTTDTDDDSDMENDNDDDEDGESENHGNAATTGEHSADESDHADDSGTNTEDDTGTDDESKRTKLKLREILFYDDKVSIFKARHGQL